ncbi:hypothetical protein IC582_022258 [Cucumis melo]
MSGPSKETPKFGTTPLDFMPERFLNESKEKLEFCPFGAGKKLCAKIPLVERMLVLILASLLHGFEWKLPKGSKLDLEEPFSCYSYTKAFQLGAL